MKNVAIDRSLLKFDAKYNIRKKPIFLGKLIGCPCEKFDERFITMIRIRFKNDTVNFRFSCSLCGRTYSDFLPHKYALRLCRDMGISSDDIPFQRNWKREIRRLNSSTWWNLYTEYLNSDEWKIKRMGFLDKQNHQCDECGGLANVVHHKSYTNISMQWNEVNGWHLMCHETDEDLQALCVDDHDKIHDEKRRILCTN